MDEWRSISGGGGAMMRFFPLCHRVQTGSGAQQATYPIGTGGSYTCDKAAGA